MAEKPIKIGVDLHVADDWVVINPESYAEGFLPSEKLGWEIKLKPKWELDQEPAVFNEDFDFNREDVQQMLQQPSTSTDSVDNIIRDLATC